MDLGKDWVEHQGPEYLEPLCFDGAIEVRSDPSKRINSAEMIKAIKAAIVVSAIASTRHCPIDDLRFSMIYNPATILPRS